MAGKIVSLNKNEQRELEKVQRLARLFPSSLSSSSCPIHSFIRSGRWGSEREIIAIVGPRFFFIHFILCNHIQLIVSPLDANNLWTNLRVF